MTIFWTTIEIRNAGQKDGGIVNRKKLTLCLFDALKDVADRSSIIWRMAEGVKSLSRHTSRHPE